MKYKYKIKIEIESEIETVNPYSEKELADITLYSLIQKNIETINNQILNIKECSNVSEMSDYLLELEEQKNIIQKMVNNNFKLKIKDLNDNKAKNLTLIVNNKK